MGLSTEDVARLAGLARIELSEEELVRLAPKLGVVLDAVASVGRLADQDIAPTSHAVHLENVFREDRVRPSWPAEDMLAAAPVVEDGRFRVPRMLDEEA